MTWGSGSLGPTRLLGALDTGVSRLWVRNVWHLRPRSVSRAVTATRTQVQENK